MLELRPRSFENGSREVGELPVTRRLYGGQGAQAPGLEQCLEPGELKWAEASTPYGVLTLKL